jgi:hypothetical protein
MQSKLRHSPLSLTLPCSSSDLGLLDVSQVSRGLTLVQKQVEDKLQKYSSSSSKMISVVAALSHIANKMELVLTSNLQKLSALDAASSTHNGSSQQEELAVEEKQRILIEAKANISDLKSYFSSGGLLEKIQAHGLSGLTGITSETQTSSSAVEEAPIQVYESLKCSNRTTVKRAAIDGPESWVISSLASASAPAGGANCLPYMEITLPQPVHLATVTIQGGIVPEGMQAQSARQEDTSSGGGGKYVLPCGLGFDDCDGSVEHTVRLLGDVISWESLIKKNPPEKFLVRPPVRFLFDLICYVVRISSLEVYQTKEETSWEVVSATKDSKMEFIGKVDDPLYLSSPSHPLSLRSSAMFPMR